MYNSDQFDVSQFMQMRFPEIKSLGRNHAIALSTHKRPFLLSLQRLPIEYKLMSCVEKPTNSSHSALEKIQHLKTGLNVKIDDDGDIEIYLYLNQSATEKTVSQSLIDFESIVRKAMTLAGGGYSDEVRTNELQVADKIANALINDPNNTVFGINDTETEKVTAKIGDLSEEISNLLSLSPLLKKYHFGMEQAAL